MTVTALSDTSIDVVLASVWVLDMDVRDADCDLVADDPPVVTVTPPVGAPDTPLVVEVSTGVYRVEYPLATAGRYVARALTSTHGAADFAAFVSAPVPASGMPDLDLVLEYLDWDTDTPADDAARSLAAESSAQRARCRVGAVYPPDLADALLRRVARSLAMKGIPLAVLRGDSESGNLVLPGNDPEVRRLEGPYRRLVMG